MYCLQKKIMLLARLLLCILALALSNIVNANSYVKCYKHDYCLAFFQCLKIHQRKPHSLITQNI